MATPRNRRSNGGDGTPPPEPLSPAGGPRLATRPLGEALADLLTRTGTPVDEVVKRMGRNWRFLLRGVEDVDGRHVPIDELARLRQLFGLPPGYFVEEREALVADYVRREPELRDRLYFALVDRDGRRAAGPTTAAALVADPAATDDADDDDDMPMALAPPTFQQLVLVLLDVSTSTAAVTGAWHRDAVDGALEALLNNLVGSQDTANFRVGFVTFNEDGAASVPPTQPELLLDPALLDGLWGSISSGAGERAEGPMLHHALGVAQSVAEPFLGEPSDVPVSVSVLVLASGEAADSAAAIEAADELMRLPATSLVSVDLIDRRPGSDPGQATLQALATDGDASPKALDAAPLADYLTTDRSLQHAGN